MEGTTQGDPLTMPWYSLSTVALINNLQCKLPEVKQVWLADDAASAGRIKDLNNWYQSLEMEGRKHGYYVNH